MKKIFAILSSANSGISQTTTALLVLILPYISLAQIKIEERVEIKPQGYQYVSDDPTSSHTIRIEMQWTPASTPGAVLGYYLPCQSANFSGFVSGGNLTYQLANVSSGGHAFQFRFNIPCNNPQPVNGQYQLYFDDVLDQSGSFNV